MIALKHRAPGAAARLKPRPCLPIASSSTTADECRVPEAVDWRKRHLDALREMESEERRWRGVEQILRRLVSRVCAVAMGRRRVGGVSRPTVAGGNGRCCGWGR